MSFTNSYSESIWSKKYRDENDKSVEDTWRRISHALASDEKEQGEFYDLLENFKFLPAGRIQASIGSSRKITSANCFVMDKIDDSMSDIFRVLKESALTQKLGGGVGYDFTTIRPQGAEVSSLKTGAGGPLSFMRIFDATTKTIVGVGQRMGAQMGIMDVSHPDVMDFITAKKGLENEELTKFNISVAISDEFLGAVKRGEDWTFKFDGKEYGTRPAQEVMDAITKNAYDYAEPGVIFIDRVNEWNNLKYCEDVRACNPCGEQPLGPYGACLLGSFNLTQYVGEHRRFDFDRFAQDIPTAVNFMDRVIDKSVYPLDAQKLEAEGKRRMGIGITGFASVLAMMGMKYGDPDCMTFIDHMMETLRNEAYRASANLARERKPFPYFNATKYLKSKFVQQLPRDIRQDIKNFGIRNSHLLSIAPTGTISLEANCVSHSIEPDFEKVYKRNTVVSDQGETKEFEIETYAYRWLRDQGREEEAENLETVADIHPKTHIAIQSRFQRYVDSSISKTINVEEDYPYEDFKDLYISAYDNGCKGLTLYRPSEKMASVISIPTKKPQIRDQKRTRPVNLYGCTYKIPYKADRGTLYITINGDPDREGFPFEVLINSDRGGEAEGWMKAIAKLISAVSTRTDSIEFLIDQFERISDSDAGAWSKPMPTSEWIQDQIGKGQVYFPLEKDIQHENEGRSLYIRSGPHAISIALRMYLDQFYKIKENNGNEKIHRDGGEMPTGKLCQSCGNYTLVKVGGCWECQSCTWNFCE